MTLPLRDRLVRYLPSWLNDLQPLSPSYGFRVVWVVGRFIDAALESSLTASLYAVGRGTDTTAHKYVGEARGVVRGRLDTNETYQAKLSTWIEKWKSYGSQRALARELAEYLGESRVRVVTRSGHWVTVDPDGTLTEHDAAWDWDSVSHPERNDPDAPWWSDEWVIVYSPAAYTLRAGTLGGLVGDDGFSIGHMVPRNEVDAIKLIMMRVKAAHSCVRAVLFTTDPDLYDPEVPASCPDGTWGAWSLNVGGSQVLSGRDLASTRYWEPR